MGCVNAPKTDSMEDLSYGKEDNWVMAGTNVLPQNSYPGVFSGYSRQERFELPQTDNQKQADCDAFYVHWRTLLNCPQQDAETVRAEIEMHASTFNNCCRVYAPNYRSATETNDSLALDIAYGDVKKAFFHFLTYWSSTRPFILAGEGQGILTGIFFFKGPINKKVHMGDPPLCPFFFVC
ncbi:hypothetical protein RFI_02312 [Reticulomyxa filosa]|uniref:Uncharacterized protein n=1 Tax=Reticulomyxa filosa TaxID=46433 RepID=X6P9C3_RETFI|nr:hypothetical protein RFI_02312 [Reticulomyxa filosa]|eukprot:ETO34776.1 hypothetical protein RFI_02312 [Reticulomyxa filosa]